MRKNIWTKNDLELLKKYALDGKTIEEIEELLGRTENAIRKQLSILDIRLKSSNKWTREETKRFAEDWVNEKVSKTALVKRYNRSWKQLSNKACAMGLGGRVEASIYLTVPMIAKEMSLNINRVYYWIDNGLKVHKNKATNRNKYLIDVNDLLVFLEEHKSFFDASKVSNYLFAEELEWFKEKRKEDFKKRNVVKQVDWTNEEDKELVNLFKLGFSDERLSKILNRTVSAIEHRRGILGLIRERKVKTGEHYTEEEILILKNNSSSKSIYELQELLPNRTISSIKRKCGKLGLTYHTDKNYCDNK